MSLPKLGASLSARLGQEKNMDLFAGMPEWLVWCLAGAAGVYALATLASVLDKAFDLDAG